MDREITCVAIDLTTHCDRRCPDCCCGIGINRKLQHHPWEYFEHAAQFIRGIERVHITGGEPTIHPHFAEFVPKLKALFGCQTLTLQTDAFRTERNHEVLHHFDHIYASRYDAKNTKAVDLLVSEFGATTWEGEFTPRSRRGSGAGCARGRSETAAYADGLFFGCCVAPGVDGAAGMEPSINWKERIVAEPLPCKDCWFSE